MKEEKHDLDWLQLSWQKRQKIGFVRILWGENYATVFELQVSNDGRKWNTIREVRDGAGGIEELAINPPVVTRYFRLYGKKGTQGGSAYAIREIEVYETTR